jgi:hypothetical protein
MATPIVPVENALVTLNELLGRPAVVYTEIIRILKDSLPGLLEAVTVTNSDPAAAPKPIGAWFTGREAIPEDVQWPAVIVFGAWQAEMMGAGIKHTGDVTVAVAIKREASQFEVLSAIETMSCIEAILWDPQVRYWWQSETDSEHAAYNRTVWTRLVPGLVEPIPVNWPAYGGWMQHYAIDQAPGAQLWRS